MELLLGNYFFVKYEDDLAKLFKALHEPEEYETLIQGSTTIVTSSSQTAIEAKIAGARVIYVDLIEDTIYPVALLNTLGIESVNGLDTEAVENILNTNNPQDNTESKEKVSAISQKLINTIR